MKLIVCAIVLVLGTVGHCQSFERRVDALEQKLENVVTKTLRQSTVIESLRQQLKNVERSEEVLKNAVTVNRRAATPVVAFMSTRQANLTHIALHQTIVFEDASVNVGNGYDNSTGIFTCPYNGLYEFATTIVSAGEQHNLNFEMMMDTTQIAYVHATLYEYDMGAQVAVVQCKQGQRVLVRQAKGSPHGLPGEFCTFSGHLIALS
ncbi:caprin-2-like [Argopecten irradians]|uniref:caprin-2-like n=1 Tax=Argopecten irradians TaxID=31199 RepID=UPI003713C3D1